MSVNILLPDTAGRDIIILPSKTTQVGIHTIFAASHYKFDTGDREFTAITDTVGHVLLLQRLEIDSCAGVLIWSIHLLKKEIVYICH